MKKYKNQKAFTLLEVIIALSLLILVFGGVISLAILSREAERSSKNNLIATYLAKEGADLVLYQREKNYIDGLSPFNEIATEVDSAVKYFLIDYTNTITNSTISDVKLVDPLKINNGFYEQTTGTETIFHRLITTTYHVAAGLLPAYIDVKTEVYWRADTKQNTYTLNTQLTDWR